MKTVMMIRFNKEGRTFWKEISNSIPRGATVSLRTAGLPFYFVVTHVHVALHEDARDDVRVLLLTGSDSLTNQYLKLEVFEGNNDWYDLEKARGNESEAVYAAWYSYIERIK